MGNASSSLKTNSKKCSELIKTFQSQLGIHSREFTPYGQIQFLISLQSKSIIESEQKDPLPAYLPLPAHSLNLATV